ncbi:N-acetylmuramoyl-L-alanine amidase [Anaerosporobacter sp.]|uniref:N-acetylmuramoyl-L-alanine amidase n=1 Tax=Anaerosporobacter sp. TaxID=1872529 RepID=UPI00286EE595|nr:N-acetylmuramoyl-L-alanine amidase [Anaerosporobacter sp.]
MNKKKIITILASALLIIGLSTAVGIKTYNVFNESDKNPEPLIPKCTVIIDAGHGGFDPGKIGVNNAKEKDINLLIALKLEKLLEQNDITVIMTRETDEGLYQASDSNKKNADLKKRVEIINSSDAVIAVSIHQNSFSEESSSGAQVFYHNKSPEGKILAEIIQEQVKETINDGNHRVAKSNESYYMLKKTECPLVIVECGFLSNWREAELLVSEKYQDKMAWAIHLGIMNYLNTYVYE